MPLTLEEFVDRVRASGLPVAAQLEGVLSEWPSEQRPADGEQLAESLVREQRLTRYQVEKLRDGHGRELVLGNYIVLDKLGQGGMGTVLKALHQRMERVVALKVLSPTVTNSEDSLRRFQREVKAAAKLEHPNIIAALDADEANGTHFLVMQFVEGTDLSAFVRSRGPLPVEAAVSCVLQAAHGLDYAHGRGVVHRDIKPSNLLLDRSGNVRILDMGLARIDAASSPLDELTTQNQILGTVDYMAPEQARDSKHADHRADIYSLGATLWFLLTGRPLFEADTIVKKLMAHQHTPIPSLTAACPQATPALEAVFARMVAKSLADRWPSMSAVIIALQAFPAVPLRTGAEVSDEARFPSSAFEPTVTHVAPQSDTDPGTEPSLSREFLSTRDSTVSLASSRRQSRGWTRRTKWLAGTASGVIVSIAAGVVLFSGLGGNRQSLNDAIRGPSRDYSSNGSGQPASTAMIRPEDFGWPADAPALAIAPFDADAANAHQQAWAKYLKMDVEVTNDIGMTFRLIPPGDFLMGSTADELRPKDDAAIDQRPHRVQIRQPFLLGTQEVTLGQFRQFVEATGHVTEPERDGEGGMGWDDVTGKQVKRSPNYSWRQTGFPQTDEHPVTNISWNDAVAFCEWLSQHDHVTYELPTEAEWEYACRAGSTERFSFGHDDAELAHFGNFYDASTKAKLNNDPNREYVSPRDGFPFTAPVGSFRANPFGLFDMHGNVWEVCSDLYHKDYDAEHGGPARSDRGGGWRNDSQFCRSGYRGFDPPSVRSFHSGLRVVRRPSESVRYGWPADAPPMAVAPFDAVAAKAHQEAWAKYLDVEAEFTNSVGMTFRLIPPGVFHMGSTQEEVQKTLKVLDPTDQLWPQYKQSESPRHKVILTQPFYLGVLEVTQSQYEWVTGANPSYFSAHGLGRQAVGDARCESFPVEMVSWNSAAGFCAKLSKMEGLSPEYYRRGATVEFLKSAAYRLPTEAEWEFACRAGTQSNFWSGDDETDLRNAAWFNRNSNLRTHSGGERHPNPFGLHDTHGNVRELCEDGWVPTFYAEFETKPAIDPQNRLSAGIRRVSRGGSSLSVADFGRSSDRVADPPTYFSNQMGFRVALPVEAARKRRPISMEPRIDAATLQQLASLSTSPTDYSWPADAPQFAKSPYDAATAKQHQQNWAKYLNVDAAITNSLGMELQLIPPGAFLMGSPVGDITEVLDLDELDLISTKDIPKYKSEAPQHLVIITRPFYIGRFEVTQGDFLAVMETNPSSFSAQGQNKALLYGHDTTKFPVDSVNWSDAVDFCVKLSLREKLVPHDMQLGSAVKNQKGTGYRLPTEAEWEHACRAGTLTRYWTGQSSRDVHQAGWFLPRSQNRPHRCGELQSNPFGLFDMYGNVYEWVQDWWSPEMYAQSTRAIDPTGPANGELRVNRGGDWDGNSIRNCRSAFRSATPPTSRYDDRGFRIVLSIEGVKNAQRASSSPTQ